MLTVICPQCKASISVEEGREFAFCTYCGAKMQIAQKTYVVTPQYATPEKPKLSVSELIYRGKKEVEKEEYELAMDSFIEAIKLNPNTINDICSRLSFSCSSCSYVDLQKLSRQAKFYRSLLKSYSHEISEIEKNSIDAHNCKDMLLLYCCIDDLERAEYVAKNYKNSISVNLINRLTFNNTNIDMICFLCNNGISIDRIFDAYFGLAYQVDLYHTTYSIYYFPSDYLKKMITLGLSLEKKIEMRIFSNSTSDYGDDYFDTMVTIRDFFKRSYSLSLSDGKSNIFNNYRFTLSEHQKHCSSTEPQKGTINTDNLRKYISEIDAILPKEEKINKTGCYVATCVYGSYDCPEVWTLRRFRDTVLMNTWYGRLFVLLYYAISPKIVEVFGETVWFRKMWLSPLDKIVKNLNEKGFSDTPYYDI